MGKCKRNGLAWKLVAQFSATSQMVANHVNAAGEVACSYIGSRSSMISTLDVFVAFCVKGRLLDHSRLRNSWRNCGNTRIPNSSRQSPQ